MGVPLVFGSVTAIADTTPSRKAAEQRAAADAKAHNTKRNKAKQNREVTNAEAQSSASTDVEFAAKVRKAIVADEKLSTYAHNVKVIVRDGRVDLVGPVCTDNEKQSVATIAANVAGKDRVTNNLTVAPE